MNWDAVSAIGEILGTILVLLTLLYLARQVAHGVTSSRAAQNMGLMDAYADFNTAIFSNLEVAQIMAKLEAGSEPSDAAQAIQMRHIAYRYGDIIFAAQTAYNEGQITDQQFRSYETDAAVYLNAYPGLKAILIEIYAQYPTVTEMPIWNGALSSGASACS